MGTKKIDICADHRSAGELLDDTCYVCKSERLTNELSTLRDQVARLTEERDARRDDEPRRQLEWRGIGVEYGGVGGQQITGDVCDKCWGSGDTNSKGADLRSLTGELKAARDHAEAAEKENERLNQEIHSLRIGNQDANAAISRQAGMLAELRAQVETAQQSAQEWASRCGEAQAQLEKVVDESCAQVEAARGEGRMEALNAVFQINGPSRAITQLKAKYAAEKTIKAVSQAHEDAANSTLRFGPSSTYEQGAADMRERAAQVVERRFRAITGSGTAGEIRALRIEGE